jgi:hypothetical protein
LRLSARAEDPPNVNLADQAVPLYILPEADVLLEEVRARLPQERLHIDAQVGTRLKREYLKFRVETILDYGAEQPMAQYAILDNFGALREVMQVRFPREGQPEYYHFEGDSKEVNPNFKPDQSVKDLQFGWNELSLAFLWWKNAKTVDRGYAKARKTFIVDIPVPEGVVMPYARVQVHIDQKEKFIYRAIAFTDTGDKVREIEADRLMKIDDLWMVKDIDIKSWPGSVKTTVTINDVQRNNQPVVFEEGRPPAEDEAEGQ